jgi:hypothetical protein
VILSEIKKKTNHQRNTDGLTNYEARQKKISTENITDEIILSVFSTVITDGISVGDGGMGGKYFRTLSNTDRYICR